MENVYITSAGKFLPNSPIGNDDMERYLGQVDGKPSPVRQLILKRNGIRQRYYALDEARRPTHNAAQLAAAAVRDALAHVALEPSSVDLLCAATTIPDLVVPGYAAMVHGELPELGPLEILSSVSVCCAGMAALGHASAQVALGRRRAAISVGAEFASRVFLAENYQALASVVAGEPVPFDIEFLRWMISDGAGAFLLQPRPNATGLSLRLDWLELTSHANENPVCMYFGSTPDRPGENWGTAASYADAATAGMMCLRQDIEIVDRVIRYLVDDFVALVNGGRVAREEIDWFLCHYSSHFFRGRIVELLEKAGCPIPEDKWFTNLYTRGNTGNASIYLMLEELFHSGRLQPGQKIVCLVPESGRFTTAYMCLTVVDGARG